MRGLWKEELVFYSEGEKAIYKLYWEDWSLEVLPQHSLEEQWKRVWIQVEIENLLRAQISKLIFFPKKFLWSKWNCTRNFENQMKHIWQQLEANHWKPEDGCGWEPAYLYDGEEGEPGNCSFASLSSPPKMGRNNPTTSKHPEDNEG